MLPIDREALIYDFGNKAQILAEITELVEGAEHEAQCEELLEAKYQEYYLERHYGSLDCNFGNLSIQEREERSELSDSPLKSVI